MNLQNAKQGEKLVTNAIAYMSEYDKQSLINILQKSGSLETELTDQQKMLDASFKALKDSPSFRKDLGEYIKEVVISKPESRALSNKSLSRALANKGSVSDFSNYVDESFANVSTLDDANKSTSTRKSTSKYNPQTGEGGTMVGNALRSIFTPENINALVGIGMGYASTKLQNKANKEGNQQAIDYKVAEANSALAEAERQKQMGLASQGKNKWILPVAIIGGVLIVGTVIFFAVRKK